MTGGARAALAFGCGAVAACSAGTASAPRATGVRLSERRAFSEVRVGGATDATGASQVLRREGATDAGTAVWVEADAGAEGGEVAWLVTHLADSPDRLDPTDGPNVRALAVRGVAGVRAVVPLFRTGDAARVPFARRVIERVAWRACRLRGGHEAVARLIAWFELGGGAIPRRPGLGAHYFWARGPETAWPRDALGRLRAWVDADAPCDPSTPRDGPGSDAGADAPR